MQPPPLGLLLDVGARTPWRIDPSVIAAVGPLPALAGRPYAVVTVPGLRDELAGAAHLRAVLDQLAG